MTRQTEDKPAKVPLARQAGAIPAEWLWGKPCAWTIPAVRDRVVQAAVVNVIEPIFERDFSEDGLTSLHAAHAEVVQSLTR